MPALQKKHKKSSVHNIKSVMNTRYGAGNRTWTCTALRPLEPESNASANSAIPAYHIFKWRFVSTYAIISSITGNVNDFFWKKFFYFFKKVLCFLEKMWYTKLYHFICACSSVDRAPASGAGCVGSIPIRRTKIAACKFLQAETYIPRFFIESFVLFWHWFFRLHAENLLLPPMGKAAKAFGWPLDNRF